MPLLKQCKQSKHCKQYKQCKQSNQSNLWWYFDPVNWWLGGSGQKNDTLAWIRLLLKVGLNAIDCVFHFYEINVFSLIPHLSICKAVCVIFVNLRLGQSLFV